MRATRNEHHIFCSGYAPRKLPADGKTTYLNLHGKEQNVKLQIRDITERMVSTVPSIFLDLLDVAAYVYSADQVLTRGGDGAYNVGAKWRRKLRFFIPVRHPGIWSNREVKDTLKETLDFLSDDDYEFTFLKLLRPPAVKLYFEFGIGPGSGFSVDEVLLFSGGLDSLGGAVLETIVNKRNVALVSHRSTPKTAGHQKRLVKSLSQRCSAGVRPFHVPVWAHKINSVTREFTQRPRSFLYACLGATVASMFKLSRIRFYENGIVSLHLPICEQVIGARATRVTHPKVLSGFAELFSLLTEREFLVENPFIWKTKADVVRLVDQASCADLIKDTRSCNQVHARTILHTHCGVCSQCIDRRFGVLAAECTQHDPAEMYKINLLTGKLEPGPESTMVESYVGACEKIDRMSEAEFLGSSGEVSRVLPYLGASSDATAEKVLDLYRRQAKEVLGVLESAFKENVAKIRNRELPDSCLLVLDLLEKYKDFYRPPEEDNVFRKVGQFWRVCYDGKQVHLKDCVGLQYIAYLLRQPDKNIPAIDLRCVAVDATDIPLYVSTETVADRQAVGEYRKALADVEEELRQAQADNDLARIPVLSKQKEDLQQEIARSTGPGGRPRKVTDDVEKARQTITAAIARVMKTIEKEHPAFQQHLHKSLRRGSVFAYTPSQPISWKT